MQRKLQWQQNLCKTCRPFVLEVNHYLSLGYFSLKHRPLYPLYCVFLAKSHADYSGCAGGTIREHSSACSQTGGLLAVHQLCQPRGHSTGTLPTQYNGSASGELSIFRMQCWKKWQMLNVFAFFFLFFSRTCSLSTRGTTSCTSKWSFVLLPSSVPVPMKWGFSPAWWPRKSSSLIRMVHKNRLWLKPPLNPQSPLRTLLIIYWWLM